MPCSLGESCVSGKEPEKVIDLTPHNVWCGLRLGKSRCDCDWFEKQARPRCDCHYLGETLRKLREKKREEKLHDANGPLAQRPKQDAH